MTKKNETVEPEVDEAAADYEAMLAHGLNGDFARVVVTIHEVDIGATYDKLKKDLEPDAERRKLGNVYDYVDRCEDNARQAWQLFFAAKVEYESLKSRLENIRASLREVVTADLNKEHAVGLRAKAPTLADIDARLRVNYADEVAAQDRQLLKSKNAVDFLEEFAKLWTGRCTRAGAMLAAVRK